MAHQLRSTGAPKQLSRGIEDALPTPTSHSAETSEAAPAAPSTITSTSEPSVEPTTNPTTATSNGNGSNPDTKPKPSNATSILPAPAPTNATAAAPAPAPTNSTSNNPAVAPKPNATAPVTTPTPVVPASKPKPTANVTAASNTTNATDAAPPVITQIITTPPPTTPTLNGTTANSGSSTEDASNGQTGIIIGGIAGGIAGIIILIWLILIPVRRRQARQKDVDWALAFGNDHGPSDNSADAVFGVQPQRPNPRAEDDPTGEKVDGYGAVDVGRPQPGEGGMMAYQGYGVEGANGSQQWLDPSGQPYVGHGQAGYQDYGYYPPGANVEPYSLTSPPQDPAAYYGWTSTNIPPGAMTSPPTPHGTPAFAPSVHRGYSPSLKGGMTSPASGPVVYMGNNNNNTYPPAAVLAMAQPEMERANTAVLSRKPTVRTSASDAHDGATVVGSEGGHGHALPKKQQVEAAGGDDIYGGLSHEGEV